MALKVPIVTEHGLTLNSSYHKIVHISIALPPSDGKPKMPDSLGNEMASLKTVRFRVPVWIDEEARRADPIREPLGEPKEYVMELDSTKPIESQCYDFLKKQRGYEEAVTV